MRLVQVVMECNFLERKGRYSLSDEVFEEIEGKPRKDRKPVVEHPVRLRFIDDRMAVRWGPESCTVIMEEVSNLERCAALILELLERINKVVPILQFKHRSLSTYWVFPVNGYNFASLESKYREKMIVSSKITDGACDSSVIIDVPVNSGILHHQSGAMALQQLSDNYLLFKLNNAPNVFLFLEASIQDKNVVEYSSEKMKDFVLKSLDICKFHSAIFHEICKEVI